MNFSLTQRKNEMSSFDLDTYLLLIGGKIQELFSRHNSDKITYDMLDEGIDKSLQILVLKEKQRQMKKGVLWQSIIGNYHTFKDMGHSSGIDVISDIRKLAFEIKSRTNTDNSSSKKSNLSRLAAYKKLHPEYTCIYGCVNDDTKEKTERGNITSIIHDGEEIWIYTGMKLLSYIFGDDLYIVLEFIKNVYSDEIKKCFSNSIR